MSIATRRGRVGSALTSSGPFDVVLLGQVISELDPKVLPEEREKKHALALAALAKDAMHDAGSLVIVEPALRDRTRHLHRVRDLLIAEHGLTVFAPCLHAAPCPMLAREGDWCHEDLQVDLPAWLVPVARAAGLRYQGLTFSYLVMRKDGRTLASEIAHREATRAEDDRALLRVVSEPFVTKGKRELFLCGTGCGERKIKAMRLDRDASLANAAFERARRGDVLRIPVPGERDEGRDEERDELLRISKIPQISQVEEVSSI